VIPDGIEASRCAQIPSPPAEPPVLVLWLNQVTRWFCGEPPQTPRADSSCESLLCTDSCPQLHLAFLATMQPTLDPVGHRVPRVEPTCLSTPGRPRKAKTFRARFSPALTQIKPQPAPAILSQESFHRFSDALVLNLPIDGCIDNTCIEQFREKEMKRPKNSNM
jgi:hypothetical protein